MRGAGATADLAAVPLSPRAEPDELPAPPPPEAVLAVARVDRAAAEAAELPPIEEAELGGKRPAELTANPPPATPSCCDCCCSCGCCAYACELLAPVWSVEPLPTESSPEGRSLPPPLLLLTLSSSMGCRVVTADTCLDRPLGPPMTMEAGAPGLRPLSPGLLTSTLSRPPSTLSPPPPPPLLLLLLPLRCCSSLELLLELTAEGRPLSIPSTVPTAELPPITGLYPPPCEEADVVEGADGLEPQSGEGGALAAADPPPA